MKASRPMNRLLQGDVGSGKTIVAAEAAMIAIENGYQVAVLAPTEILASSTSVFQEAIRKVRLSRGSAYRLAISPRKAASKTLIAEGLVHVVVGTHALLQEDVTFAKLGLAIIDEQHRFGVRQRLELFKKGMQPDVLVMTATPIPRTLALTLYGDLDVSSIDELPPGRKPIVTKHVANSAVEGVYSFLKQQIEAGRQAYVVYPIVEETETTAETKAAESMYEHLAQTVFPKLRVGLLHGKLSAEEKEAAMRSFVSGETKVLVADHGHRGGRGRAECICDGDRAGRAIRPGATSSASRTSGSRTAPKLLHSGDGQAERDRARAHSNAGRIERWILYR